MGDRLWAYRCRSDHTLFYVKDTGILHNVAEENIFRPAAWNTFGMDKEGQDYRACSAYGPLYR